MNSDMNNAEHQQFVPRSRNGRSITIVILFLLATLIAIFLVSDGDFSLEAHNYLALKISALMLLPVLYAFFHFQRNLDLLTDKEFHTILFSSSLNSQQDFFFFANNSGDIAFRGKGMERYLGDLEYGNCFEDLARVSNFSHSEKHRLYNAIENRTAEHFYVELKDEKTESVRMCLTITPLERPYGYFIIQGRKFVAKRKEKLTNATESEQNYSVHNSPARNLLHAVPFGLYSTSPSGHIRMLNTTLESWLGYDEGDIISLELALDDLLYVTDGEDRKSIEMNDLSKEVKLKHKNASIVRVHITQHINYDDDGTPTMAVGMVKKV